MEGSHITEVLAGQRSYDTVGVAEQLVVRAEWRRRMQHRLNTLDMTDELADVGWTELDDDGNVIRQPPNSR